MESYYWKICTSTDITDSVYDNISDYSKQSFHLCRYISLPPLRSLASLRLSNHVKYFQHLKVKVIETKPTEATYAGATLSTVGLNIPATAAPDSHCSLCRTVKNITGNSSQKPQEPRDVADKVINSPPPALDLTCFDWSCGKKYIVWVLLQSLLKILKIYNVC